MRANRRRDTGPELALRRELHRRGLRYRVDHAPIAGLRCRADIVFTRARVAVFVDGCFWHACPEHGNIPTANREWWQAKLELNVPVIAGTTRVRGGRLASDPSLGARIAPRCG